MRKGHMRGGLAEQAVAPCSFATVLPDIPGLPLTCCGRCGRWGGGGGRWSTGCGRLRIGWRFDDRADFQLVVGRDRRSIPGRAATQGA